MDQQAYREIVSGDRRGLLPSAARLGLSLASIPYATGSRLNGWLYDVGLKATTAAEVPVVSVGNVVAGGTGKTPVVAHVVNQLSNRGCRPAILSRGYKAGPDGTNDEKRVLDLLCRGVPHVQGQDRVSAAGKAVREKNANVLVLDDGFQHRRLGRDLDIALVDALEPWGFGRMLPRGLLREPRTALRRADLVLLTRVDQSEESQRAAVRREIESVTGRPPVEVAFPPKVLVNAAGATSTLDSLRGAPAVAFCGVGNPAAFRRSLESLGVRLLAFFEFEDHHAFGPDDVRRLTEQVAELDAPLVLCTEKDLVKVREENLGDVPLWAVRIGVSVREGAQRLDEQLDRVAGLVNEPIPTTPTTAVG